MYINVGDAAPGVPEHKHQGITMKNRFSVIFAALLTLLCVVPLGAYALDFDPQRLEIQKKSVPEGTYYVDVLIKLDKSDPDYCEVSAYNVPLCHVRYEYPSDGGAAEVAQSLDITEKSQIAQYCEDGYVSMSLHYRWVESYVIWDSEYNEQPGGHSHAIMELSGSTNFENVWEKYGPFKAAYVDKDGNVLGVSGKARRAWSMSSPYALIADGDKLKFRIFGTSPAANIAFFAVIIGVPLLIILFIITSIITRIQNAVWKRRTINNIQEGAENGEK